MMIEQPLDYDDLGDHADAAAADDDADLPGRIDQHGRAARDAIAMGACRIINIKPGRVGGHSESIRLHDLCAERGIPVWHGGMLETGHRARAQHSLCRRCPNFSLPGDVAAIEALLLAGSDRAADRGRRDGTIAVPTGPGIGVTLVARAARARHAAHGLHSPDGDDARRARGSGEAAWRACLGGSPRLLVAVDLALAGSPGCGCAAAAPGNRASDRSSRRWRGSSGSRISGCSAIRRRAPLPGAGAGRNARVVAPPPPPPDLPSLLADAEARVRRRAALAIGRVGLPEGIAASGGALTDVGSEVRQMAAFALGLLGDRAGH